MTDEMIDALNRMTKACAAKRLELVEGTPEKYPHTTVTVLILDLEMLLEEVK